MYGYIYKYTFLPTNGWYIGKHKYTKGFELDEAYWGSGVKWRKLISRYNPLEWPNLIKREIIEWCETEEELNRREIYWVAELDACRLGLNLASGGEGGWDYVNSISSRDEKSRNGKLGGTAVSKKLKDDPIFARNFGLKISSGIKQSETFHKAMKKLAEVRKETGVFVGENNPMYGHIYTDETRKKMSDSHLGEKNSQYGTHWMKKEGCKPIKVKDDEIDYYKSLGYVRGR